jgi:hypothetical protein
VMSDHYSEDLRCSCCLWDLNAIYPGVVEGVRLLKMMLMMRKTTVQSQTHATVKNLLSELLLIIPSYQLGLGGMCYPDTIDDCSWISAPSQTHIQYTIKELTIIL